MTDKELIEELTELKTDLRKTITRCHQATIGYVALLAAIVWIIVIFK